MELEVNQQSNDQTQPVENNSIGLQNILSEKELSQFAQNSESKIAEQIRNEMTQEQLFTSLNYGVKQNPDQFAEFSNLSSKTGLPVQAIQQDPEAIKEKIKADEIRLKTAFPGFEEAAKFYSDPNNAAMAHDDFSTIEKIQKIANAGKIGAKKALIQNQMANIVFREAIGSVPMSPEEKAKAKELQDSLNELSKQERDQGNLEYFLGQTAYVGGQLVTGLPEMGAGALTGVSVGMLTAGPPGAMAGAGAGVTMGLAFGSFKRETALAYYDMINMTDSEGRTVDRETARSAAVTVGLINGALDAFGETIILKQFPIMRGILGSGVKKSVQAAFANQTKRQLLTAATKEILKSSSMEAITEGLQEIVNIVGEESVKTSSNFKEKGILLSDAASRVWSVSKKSFVGSLGVTSAGSSFRYAIDSRSLQKEQQKQENNVAFYNEMAKTAKDAKILDRSEIAFKEYFNDAMEGGPHENVYVPVEQWNTFFQGKNMDPKDAASYVGATNYDEANASGGDVKVSIGDWASKVAKSKFHDGLAPDVKFSPDDLTPRQFETEKQRIIEEAKNQEKSIEKYKEYEASMPQEERRVVETVQETFADKLVKSGVEPSQAKMQASTLTQLLYVMAKKTNSDFLSYINNNQINFFGKGDAEKILSSVSQKEDMEAAKAPMGISDLVELARSGNTEGVKQQVLSLIAPFKEQLASAGIDLNQITNNEDVVKAIQDALVNAPDNSPLKQIISNLSQSQQVVKYQPSDTLFQSKKTSVGFYSPLENAIDEMDFKEMPAKDLIGRINNLSGVKKDEIEFTGLMEWLSQVEGSVSKKDVQDFLQKNGVVLEQTVRGENYVPKKLVYERQENDPILLEDLSWDDGEIVDPDREYIRDEIDNYYSADYFDGNLHEDGSKEQEWFVSWIKEWLKENFSIYGIRTTENEYSDEKVLKAIDDIEFSDITFKTETGSRVKSIKGINLGETNLEIEQTQDRLDRDLLRGAYDQYGDQWEEMATQSYYDSDFADYKFTESETGYELIGNDNNGEYYSPEFRRGFSGTLEEAKIKFAEYLLEQGKVETRDMREERLAESESDAEESSTEVIAEPIQTDESQLEKPTKQDRFKSYVAPGQKSNYREFILKLPQFGQIDNYSQHFTDDKRPLLHIRTTDRVDAVGNKVLFVEEIQSDTMQGVREETDQNVKIPFKATDAWVGLAIKKLMIVGAREGYSAIAFSPGSVQVSRWGTESIGWASPKNLTEQQRSEAITKLKNNFWGIGPSGSYSYPVVMLANVARGAIENAKNEDWYRSATEKTKAEYTYIFSSRMNESGFAEYISRVIASNSDLNLLEIYDKVKTSDANQSVKNFNKYFWSKNKNLIKNYVKNYFNLDSMSITEGEFDQLSESVVRFMSSDMSLASVSVSSQKFIDGVDSLNKTIKNIENNSAWFVSATNQLGGLAGDINIEQEARRRGLIVDQGEIVESKDSLLKIIKSVTGGNRSAENIADQMWAAMQAGKDGVKQPRKEGLLYVYDKIIPKVAKEVASKIDKEAKLTDSKMDIKVDGENVTAKTLPITDKIKEKVLKTGLPLFQDDNGESRGFVTFSIDPNTKKRKFDIGFLNKDLSTAFHELGHVYLELLADAAEVEGADPKLKEDFGIVLKWLGVNNRSEITVEHHEKFARGHEMFIREGRAPSLSLVEAFRRYSKWLVSIVYPIAKSLNVTLNDDVRGVFDRMYATEEQINQLTKESPYVGLISSAKEFGLTEDEFRVYLELNKASIDSAKDKLLAKLIRQKERDLKEEKRIIKEQKKKEYKTRKDVRALAVLTDGKLEDGTELKINTANAENTYSDLKKQIKKEKSKIFADDGNASVDEAANYLGYKNGAELLEDIINVPKESEFVESETERVITEKYGDSLNDGTLVDDAISELHSEKRAELLQTELRVIAKKIKETKKLTAAERSARKDARDWNYSGKGKNRELVKPLSLFKNIAIEIIRQKRLMDIYPNSYLVAEKRASKEAFRALADGNYDLVRGLKEKEILNHYLYLEAIKAKKLGEKAKKFADSFNKKKLQKIGKADPNIPPIILAILDRYNFRRMSPSQVDNRNEMRTNVVDYLSKKDFENEAAPVIDAEIATDLRSRNYTELNTDELQAVIDALKSLAHVAEMSDKLFLSEDKRSFAEEIVDELVQAVEQNKGSKKPVTMSGVDPFEGPKELAERFYLSHRKFADLIKELDGFKSPGKFWTHIVRTMNDAGVKEVRLLAEYSKKLNEILEPFYKIHNTGIYGVGKKKTYFNKLGVSLSWENRMAVALNWGNEGNRQRLIDGQRIHGWTEDGIQDVLNSLTKEEWDAVQAIWDLMESLRPLIAEKERRVTGLEPKWVKPTNVVTKHGVYKGGYYPIVYDPKGSPAALNQMDEEEARSRLKGTQFAAKPRDGFKKERVDRVVDRPLMITMIGAYRGLEDVIHDLAWHEWVIDANKVFRNYKISKAINNNFGSLFLKEIKSHIEDIAAGQSIYGGSRNWMDYVANHIRSGSAVAQLGFNLFNTLQNMTGLSQSIPVVGVKYFFKSIAQYADHPFKLGEFVLSKSEFLRNRELMIDRDLGEVRQKIAGKTKLRQKADKIFMAPAMWTQKIVDVITWNAAYEKYMFEGNNEKRSIALADQAVIDAQGSSGVQNLASIQKGGPYQKLYTMFYNYFSHTLGIAINKTKQTDFSLEKPDQTLKLAFDYFCLFVAPAALTQILKIVVAKQTDDDKENQGKALARETLYYTLNMFPLIREVAPQAISYSLGLESRRKRYDGTAVERLGNQITNLAYDISDGKTTDASIKALNQILGIGLKLPTAQAYKTLSGAMSLYDGETKNPLILIGGPPPGKR